MASILTFDGLMEAARQCALGVKWKDSIAAWTHPRNIALNCLKLKQELDNGTYRLGGYVTFDVTEPKRRTIRSPKFRDRVVQRAMCNAGLYDDLTRGNIHDNGACQNRKGTTFTMDRLECHMQRHWRKHGSDGWVLRLDIRRFFDSIPHERLKEMVARNVRCDEFKRRVHEIIDSFDDPGIGLGSQISQLLAIAYLSELDHYIKERLGVRHYVRYSDDIVMIHESREFLHRTWMDVAGRLTALGLQLNPKSTLHPLKQGVRFLKFRFILTDTGKVIRLLDNRNIVRIRKRFKRLSAKVATGERDMADLNASFNSWKAHAEQGDSNNKIRRLRKWLLRLTESETKTETRA